MSVPPIGPATVVPSAAQQGSVQHPTVMARISRSALPAVHHMKSCPCPPLFKPNTTRACKVRCGGNPHTALRL